VFDSAAVNADKVAAQDFHKLALNRLN
jgi:hypothetical protein